MFVGKMIYFNVAFNFSKIFKYLMFILILDITIELQHKVTQVT